MNNINNDTIAAISTPLGEGGISIVRLSGRDSVTVADKIFDSFKGGPLSSRLSHTVHYGYIKTPETGEIIDEVLLTIMRAPRTYTKEDVVEINCHGGVILARKILELCLKQGLRLAGPGEFTRRAFLNGRIDLSQAEAVMDIIKAETEISTKIAARQLNGEFSEQIRNLRNSVIKIISLIEVTMDFSQEDVDFPMNEEISNDVNNIYSSILKILKTAEKGMIFREGASIVICGRPNVGKSSLMNALLRHDRVIVASQGGTTRDIIEESIDIEGVRVKLSDTAGIIDTQDRVEREGIKRSIEKLALADIVIFMLDYSQALSERDKNIYETIKHKRNIIVANKTDLAKKLNISEAEKYFGGEKILKISVLKRKGFKKVEDAIAEKLFKDNIKIPEGPVVTNIRHKRILEKAAESLKRAMGVSGNGYNAELLASDLNEAVYQLGLIIGESVGDDILDRIFSQFCIGK